MTYYLRSSLFLKILIEELIESELFRFLFLNHHSLDNRLLLDLSHPTKHNGTFPFNHLLLHYPLSRLPDPLPVESLFDFLLITLNIFITRWLPLALIPPLISDLPDLLILLSPLEPQLLVVFGLLSPVEGLSVPEVPRLLVLSVFLF